MVPSSPDRDALIQHLFDEVVDLAPEERAIHLNRACADDPTLCREIEALLAAQTHTADLFGPLHHPTVAPAATGSDVQVEHIISHYRIEEQLGGGGMGIVYKAYDTRLDRPVALKFLPPELTRDPDARERFIHEAKAASALDHVNICTVYDIDATEAGQLFIAMAYVEGETLKKKIARGPLPMEEALAYAVQVAEGLAKAHEAGIVHRDVKPANVMITEGKVAKIVDFGLAKMADVSLTKTETTLGTVAYMSPEQALGQAVDERTDLWSLGVVLYEMLTGERPFRGDYEQAVLYALHNVDPAPITTLRPETPFALQRIGEKLLQKNPVDRYANTYELLKALRPFVKDSASAMPFIRPRSDEPFAGRDALISIAVLPMTNRSGDSGQEHIVDGMTDLLINNLSRLSGLDRVIARTTMMRYKHIDKSPRQIGRELNVDLLVEASVLSDGVQVLVTVNLIEAVSERTLWGAIYEQAFKDVLRLQREMTTAIAREIEVQLTPEDEARLAEAPEVDPAAFAFYLKGVQVMDEADWPSLDSAATYFEQAITLDASYAPAYAGLAISSALFSTYSSGKEASRARRATKKALQLNPSLSDAYVALGLIHQFLDWDWHGAEQAFRQAITLHSRHAMAHHEMGMLLARRGQFEDAIDASQRALFFNPLSATYRLGLGLIHFFKHKYDQAIATFTEVLAERPDLRVASLLLGEAYLYTGHHEKALQAWTVYTKEEQGPAQWIGIIYAAMGRREEALKEAESLIAQWERGERWPSYTLALIYSQLNEKDQALEWLERSYEGMINIKVEPGFAPLRSEPRFQALLKMVGLE